MNAQQNWYNTDLVDQKRSVILTNWKREREQSRAQSGISNADSVVIKSGDPQVLDLFGISNKTAVTPQTAQRLSAVGASITLRGNAMSSLPIHHYRTKDNGTRERVPDSQFYKMLNLSPVNNWTAAAMYQWWERCYILRGDAYAEILRDRRGNPIGLLPWHPDRVTTELQGNDLVYMYSPDAKTKPYPRHADDVIHIPGNGFDGQKSLSAVQYDAYNSIGIALAANAFSRHFFENGASPKHLFETEKRMDVDQIDSFRELYDSRYAGPVNAGRPMILTEGLKMHALSMSALDAQLLESIKYSVIDIARACGVPPVLIGAQETTSSWGTGVSEIKQGFVTFHLAPRANVWQQELNRKLIRKDGEFVEHAFEGFLQGDAKAEGEALRQSVGGSQGPGWQTINEVRRIKNLPPADGGDALYIPKGNSNEQKTSATN